MIPSPYRFEPDFTDQEYAKLGVLTLRWSHIEHVLGNCLKVLLRLSDEEAVTMVFPLSGAERVSRIAELSKTHHIPEKGLRAFEELKAVLVGLRYVRNNVVHSIVMEDEKEGHVFHLRSKMRSLTKEQVFSVEELTNYAAHLVIAFRYSLGFKGDAHDYSCPERPPIPDFLKPHINLK